MAWLRHTRNTVPFDRLLRALGAPEPAEVVRALAPWLRRADRRSLDAVAALHRHRRLSLGDARLWSAAERRRLFDPATLARPCAHDPVLAVLADRVFLDAVARLRAAGDDPALLALEALSSARRNPTIRLTTNSSGSSAFTSPLSCV